MLTIHADNSLHSMSCTLHLHKIQWIVGSQTMEGKNVIIFGQAGKALRAGARANKIVRIFVRVLKYSKVLKVFRYTPKASMRLKAVAKVLSETGKVDDVPEKSRVGAAMTDLMNQRCTINDNVFACHEVKVAALFSCHVTPF